MDESMRIGKYKVYREKAGVISENKIWVLIDDSGYLYCQENFLAFLKEIIFEWKQDQHLVG